MSSLFENFAAASRWLPEFKHQQNTFINNTLAPVQPLAGLLGRAFSETARKFDYVRANQELLQTVEKCHVADFNLSVTDDELSHFAGKKAERGELLLKEAKRTESADTIRSVLDAAHELCQRYTLTLPDPDKCGPLVALAKIADPAWWRRKLRRLQMRRIETLAVQLGRVRRGRECYCSDEIVKRGRGHKERNRRTLEALIATNGEGDEFSLAELAELFSPAKRRGEMMLRCRGFEEVATLCSHAADFWTITCPSRFHRFRSVGEGKRRHFYANPNWSGALPSESNQYLQEVWQRTRAALHRRGIRVYGFRVAEAHHDGCVHWHLLLWMQPEQVEAARAVMRGYAMKDSPDESGAQEFRVKFEAITPEKGSATGYIAKYIAKAIHAEDTGDLVQQDLYGQEAGMAAERVQFWAQCWGIRQFQQIGGPSVTVWRELRRAASDDAIQADFLDTELRVQGALNAADEGDWAAYVLAMGGPMVKRDEQLLRSAYWVEAMSYTADGEFMADLGPAALTKYGEQAKGRIFGLRTGDQYLLTRTRTWTVERRATPAAEVESTANRDAGQFLRELSKEPIERWAAWSVIGQAQAEQHERESWASAPKPWVEPTGFYAAWRRLRSGADAPPLEFCQ